MRNGAHSLVALWHSAFANQLYDILHEELSDLEREGRRLPWPRQNQTWMVDLDNVL